MKNPAEPKLDKLKLNPKIKVNLERYRLLPPAKTNPIKGYPDERTR